MRGRGSLGTRIRRLEGQRPPERLEEIRERVEREIEESRTPEGIAAAKALRDAIFGVAPQDHERERSSA